MNFLHDLEECLRDLAAEARKKHPGVKEASERATLKLRLLQNQYVSLVRKANAATAGGGGGQQQHRQQQQTGSSAASTAGKHPTTRLFQSSEILHPFLLAANYPNASPRLLEITFRAFQLLILNDAILPSDGIHILRVWMIQAQVVIQYYQKVYGITAATGNAANTSSTQSNSKRRDNNNNTTTGGNSSGHNIDESGASSAPALTSTSWFSWASATSSSVMPTSLSMSSTTLANKHSGVATHSSSSTNTHTMTSAVVTSSGVSSSSGQTGASSSTASSLLLGSQTSTQLNQMYERRALEILSCLLQLLQTITTTTAAPSNLTALSKSSSHSSNNSHSNAATAASSSSTNILPAELWTNAMALGCLWLHYLPKRHRVREAARSTVTQLLTLFYQQQSQLQFLLRKTKVQTQTQAQTQQSSSTSSSSPILSQQQQQSTAAAAAAPNTAAAALDATSKKLILLISKTWDDLLFLTRPNNTAGGGGHSHQQHQPSLQGIFALCRCPNTTSTTMTTMTGTTSTPPFPPTPEFALELLMLLWKDTSILSPQSQSPPPHPSSSLMVSFLSHQQLERTYSITLNLLQDMATPPSSLKNNNNVMSKKSNHHVKRQLSKSKATTTVRQK